MRPVARIAQSVEQGIENPRVLGSIPSPGTTYSENPAYGWVFAFLQPTANRRPDKRSAIRHSMPIVVTFNFSHRLFITNAGLQFGCDILH